MSEPFYASFKHECSAGAAACVKAPGVRWWDTRTHPRVEIPDRSTSGLGCLPSLHLVSSELRLQPHPSFPSQVFPARAHSYPDAVGADVTGRARCRDGTIPYGFFRAGSGANQVTPSHSELTAIRRLEGFSLTSAPLRSLLCWILFACDAM